MAIRRTPLDEATRRARRQLNELNAELIAARHRAGLSQATVARALGRSRPLLASWERGRIIPNPIQLSRWAAVVGLETSLRAFPGGSPLRDAGQVRLLERFRALIGHGWEWRTEVPVSPDPRDRRALDGVLRNARRRVGVEAVMRFTDSQGQVRPILLKQRDAGLPSIVLVLADTRHNRLAMVDGAATIAAAFPCPPRVALAALRRGDPPPDNAIVFA